MNGKKIILLAEDSDRDAELISMALDGIGISVDIRRARDGVEVLELLHANSHSSSHPSLVLLDIKLPRLHGMEVLGKIKSNALTKHIPVVMFTSSQDQKDIEESYRLGANAYVVKPIDFNELFETLTLIGKFWCGINKNMGEY